MRLDDKAILSAVGQIMREERAVRDALAAEVRELAARIDDYGNVVATPGPQGERGPAGERGLPGETGRDGRDGLPGRDGAPGAPGERGEPGPAAYVGEARGLWSAEAAYRAMDVVTFNGSEWRAITDDPGALPGPGWMLGAKGVKGRPGDRGERGERGPAGPAGHSIDEVVIDDFTLVFLCSNGTTLRCDLFPLFERMQTELAA